MKTGAPSRWPVHCRIYRMLSGQHKNRQFTLAQIMDCVHCAETTARLAIKDLKECGLLHVSSWKRGPGFPILRIKFGFGIDAVRPAAEAPHLAKIRHYHRKKAKVIEAHGVDVWKRMRLSRNLGGADKIVISGQIVYERRPA